MFRDRRPPFLATYMRAKVERWGKRFPSRPTRLLGCTHDVAYGRIMDIKNVLHATDYLKAAFVRLEADLR